VREAFLGAGYGGIVTKYAGGVCCSCCKRSCIYKRFSHFCLGTSECCRALIREAASVECA